MKKRRAWRPVVLLAGLAAFYWSPVAHSSAAPADQFAPHISGTGETVTCEGVLVYFPPPDLTICFCGSYYLTNSNREAKSYYLLSSGMDLGLFIGKKITVTGKSVLIPCLGTLFQYCDFLILERIEENTATDGGDDTWGRIKALYR